MQPSSWLIGLLLLLLVVGGLILIRSMAASKQTSLLSYSSLLNQAQSANIASLAIDGSQGTAVDRAGRHFRVQLPASTAQLAQQLTLDGVDVGYKSRGGTVGDLVTALLPSLILLLLIGGFMYYILRQTQGGSNQAMSLGRSRARMITGDKPQVTFADVAGRGRGQAGADRDRRVPEVPSVVGSTAWGPGSASVTHA